MDAQIEKALASLESRHIRGIFAQNFEDAGEKIMALIPPEAVVGIGDSTTLRQLGVFSALRERGIKILNSFEPKRDDMAVEDFRRWRAGVAKEASQCDVFLTGTNALTEDGRLVNVDATGNRVAGMFWGHPLSITVVGKNKIVKTLDEAFHRLRKIIAPTHFRVRNELGGRRRDTPCTAKGKCTDCRSGDRGCNVFTVIEGKPASTALHVIIVDQDLGLGWDPSWPEERIANILAEYKRCVWLPV